MSSITKRIWLQEFDAGCDFATNRNMAVSKGSIGTDPHESSFERGHVCYPGVPLVRLVLEK